MLIRFFRQSFAIQYVVIALMAIILWIPSFIVCPDTVYFSDPVNPIYNLFANLLDFSPYAMQAFAFLLLLFEMIFFNSILADNQIITRVSTIGAVLFLLLMSLSPLQLQFSPFLLSCVFILMMIHTLFLVYQTNNPEIYLFNAGVYLALATMCYFNCILLLIWSFIALFVMSQSKLRHHIIPVVGFLLPYFLLFSGYYLFGDLKAQLQDYADFFSSLTFSFKGFTLNDLIVLGVLVVLSSWPFLSGVTNSYEKSIAMRIKITLSFILLGLSIISLLFGDSMSSNSLIMIPLAILFSFELAYTKKTRWAGIILLVFMLLIFANQYYSLFVAK